MRYTISEKQEQADGSTVVYTDLCVTYNKGIAHLLHWFLGGIMGKDVVIVKARC